MGEMSDGGRTRRAAGSLAGLPRPVRVCEGPAAIASIGRLALGERNVRSKVLSFARPYSTATQAQVEPGLDEITPNR